MKRYKNNVGKSIGGAVYFHRLYLKEIVPNVPPVAADLIRTLIPEGFNIVKLVPKKTLSFILSPDFDTANEPIIQEVYTYHYEHDIWSYHSYFNDNPPIYHHKWLFVKDSYMGFCIDDAKLRSVHINAEMDRRKIDRRKIGYLKYWKTLNI